MRQTVDDYTANVYTTWRINFDRLDDVERRFWGFCSFLHFDSISLSIFELAAAQINGFELWHTLTSASWVSTCKMFLLSLQPGTAGESNKEKYDNLMESLQQYSFVHRTTEVTFSIHPLVHEWIRKYQAEQHDVDAQLRAAALLLLSSVYVPNLPPLTSLTSPHVLHALSIDEPAPPLIRMS